MRRGWIYFVILFLCSVGCQEAGRKQFNSWLDENGNVKILCTTVFVGELVQAIAGEDFDVIVLIPPCSDPHSYQLVKGDDEKFRRADCVFSSGLGLEHRGALARYLSLHNAVSITTQLEKEEIITDGTTVDPHVWLDLSLWAKGVDCVVDVLAQKRERDRAVYKERGERVRRSLLRLHKKIRSLLQAIPDDRRFLVTTHNAFQYFSRAYLARDEEWLSGEWKKRCRAPEGLSPESQINTRDLYAVVEYILEHGVSTIFAEHGMNRDSIERLVDGARSKGHEVSIAKEMLYSDSLGTGVTHIDMLEHNARIIAEALA